MRKSTAFCLAHVAFALAACQGLPPDDGSDPGAGIDDCDPYVPPQQGRGDVVAIQGVAPESGETAAIMFSPELLTDESVLRPLVLGIADANTTNDVRLFPRKVYRVGITPGDETNPPVAIVTRFPESGSWSRGIHVSQAPNGLGVPPTVTLTDGAMFGVYLVDNVVVYTDDHVFTLDLWRP